MVSLQKYSSLVSGLALLGCIVSLYLTYVHYAPYFNLSPGISCNFSKNLNCDAVLTSDYSELFGVPVAFLGALSYLFVILLARSLPRASHQLLRVRQSVLFSITLCMLLFSAYLFIISRFVIQSFCVFCVITYIINIALFIALFLRWKYHSEEFSTSLSLKAVGEDSFIVWTVALLLSAIVVLSTLDTFLFMVSLV